jgi:hypothetical protein
LKEGRVPERTECEKAKIDRVPSKKEGNEMKIRDGDVEKEENSAV